MSLNYKRIAIHILTTYCISPFRTVSSTYILILGIIQLVAGILVWQLMANGSIAGFAFPTPISVLEAFPKLFQQGLIVALIQSAVTLLTALGIASVLSIAIASLSSLILFKPVAIGIKTLRFIGFTGLTIIFGLMIDTSHSIKIALLVFGITMSMTTSLMSSIDEISNSTQEMDYAHTLKLSPWRILLELFIFARLHVILSSIRHNAAVGWTLLTMVESFTQSEGGVGVLLLRSTKYIDLSTIIAIQFTILTYGFCQDKAFQLAIKKICPWVKMK